MRLNVIALAKMYLVLSGLINLNQVISLLGVYETLTSAPPYLSFMGWHLLFSLGYGILPIITVLLDHKKSWLLLVGVFLLGVLLAALNVVTWVPNFHVMFAVLNSLAAVFAFHLAVENVGLEVATEILSLERSQF